MGSSYKRVSFFFIYIIFLIYVISLLFVVNSLKVYAQESDSIYIETMTISIDSQELLNLEQEISEIPIDYDLLTLTENFITSYEQLSLNVIQFKYDQNFYFSNLLYSTLWGYRTLLYYSSNFGASFFQGFSFFEVFPYLPFYSFHLFQNNFELQKKFINWSVDYKFYFESYNLPQTDYLNFFSSILSKQEVNGKNNNFDFSLSIQTLSVKPTYDFYLLEKLNINYLIFFNDNIYSKISLNQFYERNFSLKPEFSIFYNFSTIDIGFGVSYDIFLNNFNGFFNLFYDDQKIKILLSFEKNSDYQFLNDKYTIISNENWCLYKDFINSVVGFSYRQDIFSFSTKLQYSYFYKMPIKIYDEQGKIFNIIQIENSWSIYFSVDFDWQINPVFGLSFNFLLNLPSYYLSNSQIMQNIIETYLKMNIKSYFYINDKSILSFIVNSEIIRKYFGENNPVYNFQIEYKFNKTDFEVNFILTLNLNSFYILPFIESPIINLTATSQFYF